MLQSSLPGTTFSAGDVVYIRARVEGFDAVLPGAETCILVPINKDGAPCAPGWVYYADPMWLVHGQVVKAEIKGGE